MSLRDIVLALTVMSIWGVSFSVVKVGLEELPPFLFIAMRFLVVAIPAIFFVPFPRTSAWSILAVGLLIGVIKFGLLFVAMKNDSNAGVASLVLQSQVFFTIGLSFVFFNERTILSQGLGILLAVAGFALFFVSAGGNITITGLILILIAAIAWALSNIVMKKIPDVNLLHFMIWVSLVPPIPLLIFSYFTETENPVALLFDASISAWFAIAYMGYFSTLVAYAAWGALLKRHTASTVTPFALLIPVIGISTSALWLREALTPAESIGTALIMVGLVVCVLGERIAKVLVSGSAR